MADTLHTVESTGLPRAAGPLRYANERPGERVVNTDAEKRAELARYFHAWLGYAPTAEHMQARIDALGGNLDNILGYYRNSYSEDVNSRVNNTPKEPGHGEGHFPGAFGPPILDERPEPGLEHVPAAHDSTQLREVRKRSHRRGHRRRYAGERPGERVANTYAEQMAEVQHYWQAVVGTPLQNDYLHTLIQHHGGIGNVLTYLRDAYGRTANRKDSHARVVERGSTAGLLHDPQHLITPEPTPEPELEPYDTGHGNMTMRRKQASRRGRRRRLAALPRPVRVQGRQVHSTEEFGQEFGRLGNSSQPDFLHDPTDEQNYQAVVKHLLLSHPHLVRPFTNSLPDSTLLLHAFRDHFRGGVTPQNAHEFGEMLPSMVRVQPRRPANVGPSSHSVTALRGTLVDVPQRKSRRRYASKEFEYGERFYDPQRRLTPGMMGDDDEGTLRGPQERRVERPRRGLLSGLLRHPFDPGVSWDREEIPAHHGTVPASAVPVATEIARRASHKREAGRMIRRLSGTSDLGSLRDYHPDETVRRLATAAIDGDSQALRLLGDYLTTDAKGSMGGRSNWLEEHPEWASRWADTADQFAKEYGEPQQGNEQARRVSRTLRGHASEPSLRERGGARDAVRQWQEANPPVPLELAPEHEEPTPEPEPSPAEPPRAAGPHQALLDHHQRVARRKPLR